MFLLPLGDLPILVLDGDSDIVVRPRDDKVVDVQLAFGADDARVNVPRRVRQNPERARPTRQAEVRLGRRLDVALEDHLGVRADVDARHGRVRLCCRGDEAHRVRAGKIASDRERIT